MWRRWKRWKRWRQRRRRWRRWSADAVVELVAQSRSGSLVDDAMDVWMMVQLIGHQQCLKRSGRRMKKMKRKEISIKKERQMNAK